MAQGDNAMPIIEADRDVIAFFNKDLMQHVDKVGYFIMNDVAVCERGKLEQIKEKMAREATDNQG